jgi:Secretion system C-terminal sorting domain
MKKVFTLLLSFYAMALMAQPAITLPSGYTWMKTSANQVYTSGPVGTGSASGNITGSCTSSPSCGGNDTSFGWESLCSTTPSTAVVKGNPYVQAQAFGNLGNSNNGLANLVFFCNPASGNPNWGSSTSETRRIALSHWTNAFPSSAVPNGSTSGTVNLPTKSELEILDDGAGNGTGVGADELKFTILGGFGGNCSNFTITATYGMQLTVADAEFGLSTATLMATQTVTQAMYGPEPGSGNAYNLTDGTYHDISGGCAFNSSSWYSGGGAFGTGVGATSGGVGTKKIYTGGTVGQSGGSFNVDFIGNASIGIARTSGNADGRATMGPGMGGKAKYSVTYDVWTIQVPLALDLTSFSGQNTAFTNVLKWTTNAEDKVASFKIERSSDNKTWSNIGIVKATNNVNGAAYNYKDNTPLSTVNYYRLCMVDLDEKGTYSKTIALNGVGQKKGISVSPNPVKSELVIVSDEPLTGSVSIFDITGRLVRQIKDNPTKIDVSDLASGMYILRFSNNQALVNEPIRFVKQ